MNKAIKETIRRELQSFIENEDKKNRDMILFGMCLLNAKGECIPIDSISEEDWFELYKAIDYVKNIRDIKQ